MTLFDPARHEVLGDVEWNDSVARAWIARTADDAHECFAREGRWPPHPLDTEGDGARVPAGYAPLYMGAGGVAWALDVLAQRGLAQARDYRAKLDAWIALNQREVATSSWEGDSLMLGQSGLLLLKHRLAPDEPTEQRLHASVLRNTANPSNEVFLGAAGTLHAALAMHEWTPAVRWSDAYADGVAALERAVLHDPVAGCELWTQPLHGNVRYLGAAHGFAGNAQAVLRGGALLDASALARWIERIVRTVSETAVRAAGRANWPAWLPAGASVHRLSEWSPRWMLQWCHGAPGILTSLAHLQDTRLDDVFREAGELIWHAGPLAKGGGLCHGTAGNGWALLKLFERTGDARWKVRARAFAMHAMTQCDAHAHRYGRPRYSLWTGDLGTALYIAACIDGDARLPHIEPASPRSQATAPDTH